MGLPKYTQVALDVAKQSARATGAKAEEKLIRGFLATRDPRLFQMIVDKHLPWLRRLLFSIFNGNTADMEDALQEILCGILHDLRRYRFQSAFKTFFYRYAKNKAVDLLRRMRRGKIRETAVVHGDGGVSRTTPEADFLRDETAQELKDALATLAKEDQTLLLMKDVEGFSFEEISAITGKKTGTLKSRLHRLRLKLFHMLERRIR